MYNYNVVWIIQKKMTDCEQCHAIYNLNFTFALLKQNLQTELEMKGTPGEKNPSF